MSYYKDGGPAFPSPHMAGQTGITMRDYLAAKAMAAMIAEHPWYEGAESIASRNGNHEKGEFMMFADAAYKMADAMLAARDAKP